MAVEPGDYGPVRVLRGPHAGRIAYYDDDETEYDSDEVADRVAAVYEAGGDPATVPGHRSVAIVYLGVPFVSDYVLVPYADLEPVEASPAVEKWVVENPKLARQVGVAEPTGTTKTADPPKSPA